MALFSSYPAITFATSSAEPVVQSFPHACDFDPTYGSSFDDLLAVELSEAVPENFESFWHDLRDRALATPLDLKREPGHWQGRQHFKLSHLRFTSLGGVRLGAWLLSPPDESTIERAVLFSHGYGGREEPEIIAGLEERTALIFPCARGLSLSHDLSLGVHQHEHHVLVGIESRENYIHGGCVADHIAATSALLHLFPQVAGRIGYLGTSFGGGLGALLLPWEDRIRCGVLGQPSFGHHPLRVQLPCNGSGDAVRRRYLQDPCVLEVLAYFDAAHAARFIRQPVMVATSLFDPVVPPPGQFAVYNAIAKQSKQLHVMPSGHFEHPGQARELVQYRDSIRHFFSDL